MCEREREPAETGERVCVIRVCMCESVDSRDPQPYEAALREKVCVESGERHRCSKGRDRARGERRGCVG